MPVKRSSTVTEPWQERIARDEMIAMFRRAGQREGESVKKFERRMRLLELRFIPAKYRTPEQVAELDRLDGKVPAEPNAKRDAAVAKRLASHPGETHLEALLAVVTGEKK